MKSHSEHLRIASPTYNALLNKQHIEYRLSNRHFYVKRLFIMKISASFAALAFALATTAAAGPAGFSSLETEALEVRANDPGDGGGWCKYNPNTKRCSMVNMRGSGSAEMPPPYLRDASRSYPRPRKRTRRQRELTDHISRDDDTSDDDGGGRNSLPVISNPGDPPSTSIPSFDVTLLTITNTITKTSTALPQSTTSDSLNHTSTDPGIPPSTTSTPSPNNTVSPPPREVKYTSLPVGSIVGIAIGCIVVLIAASICFSVGDPSATKFKEHASPLPPPPPIHTLHSGKSATPFSTQTRGSSNSLLGDLTISNEFHFEILQTVPVREDCEAWVQWIETTFSDTIYNTPSATLPASDTHSNASQRNDNAATGIRYSTSWKSSTKTSRSSHSLRRYPSTRLESPLPPLPQAFATRESYWDMRDSDCAAEASSDGVDAGPGLPATSVGSPASGWVKVTRPAVVRRSDDLALALGDSIRVLAEYEDGSAYCLRKRNFSNRQIFAYSLHSDERVTEEKRDDVLVDDDDDDPDGKLIIGSIGVGIGLIDPPPTQANPYADDDSDDDFSLVTVDAAGNTITLTSTAFAAPTEAAFDPTDTDSSVLPGQMMNPSMPVESHRHDDRIQSSIIAAIVLSSVAVVAAIILIIFLVRRRRMCRKWQGLGVPCDSDYPPNYDAAIMPQPPAGTSAPPPAAQLPPQEGLRTFGLSRLAMPFTKTRSASLGTIAEVSSTMEKNMPSPVTARGAAKASPLATIFRLPMRF
ncbi:unnamed protein product [Cyclocybe aegerita]|uniref:Uncharacterized protein n=1 Tax=Cyclocybe aegerita TaxID=1973307 RepID=A0A8S0X984_CYCAE|nr:unnamed protein product [Cyclocybe aegerita]